LATIALIGVIPARCLASDAAGAVLFFILPPWPNCERLREIARGRGRWYYWGPRNGMQNDHQKCIGRNEPHKWNYLYTIVGLNRISDTFFRELEHELRWTILSGTGPAWDIASIHYRPSSDDTRREIKKYRGGTYASK
jgi:hypothetical protein